MGKVFFPGEFLEVPLRVAFQSVLHNVRDLHRVHVRRVLNNFPVRPLTIQFLQAENVPFHKETRKTVLHFLLNILRLCFCQEGIRSINNLVITKNPVDCLRYFKTELGLVQTSIFTCTEPNVSIKYM